jgi:hypothetical protein
MAGTFYLKHSALVAMGPILQNGWGGAGWG